MCAGCIFSAVVLPATCHGIFIPSPKHKRSTPISEQIRVATASSHLIMDQITDVAAEMQENQCSKLFSRVLDTVHEDLMACLTIKDILNLCGTSRAVQARIRDRWDINEKLRRFNVDPVAFRSQLGQCNALISGNFPWHFLGNKCM